MKNAISLDQMLQNIKERSEDSRLTMEAAEKTIKIQVQKQQCKQHKSPNYFYFSRNIIEYRLY